MGVGRLSSNCRLRKLRSLRFEPLEPRRVLTGVAATATPEVFEAGDCHSFDVPLCLASSPTFDVSTPNPNRIVLQASSSIATIEDPGFGLEDMNATGFDGVLEFEITGRQVDNAPVRIDVSWTADMTSNAVARSGGFVNAQVRAAAVLRADSVVQPLFDLGINNAPAGANEFRESSFSFVTTADTFEIDAFAYNHIRRSDGTVAYDVTLTVEARPELAVYSAHWNEEGGADFHYDFFADPGVDANLEVYYADGDSWDDRMGDPVAVVAALQDSVAQEVSVANSTLGVPPVEATHVLIAGDAPLPLGNLVEADELNNLTSLALPDVSLSQPVWQFDRSGLEFLYQVEHADLSSNVDIDFFWTSGETTLGAAVAGISVDGTRQTTEIYVPGSAFGIPPVEATGVLVVADLTDDILERFEDNNQVAINLQYDARVADLAFDASTIQFNYSVGPVPLATTTDFAVYWSEGDSANDRIGDALLQYAPPSNQLFDTISFTADQLGYAPSAASHLVVVADPPSAGKPQGDLNEIDESNNHSALDILIAPGVELTVLPVPPEIGAPYSVEGVLTNNSPVNLRFQLDWREQYWPALPPEFIPALPPSGTTAVDVPGLGSRSFELACPASECVHDWQWIPQANPVRGGQSLQEATDPASIDFLLTALETVGIGKQRDRLDVAARYLATALESFPSWTAAHRSAVVQTLADVSYGPPGTEDAEAGIAFELYVSEGLESAFNSYLAARAAAKQSLSATVGALVSSAIDNRARETSSAITGVSTAALLVAAERSYGNAVRTTDPGFTQLPAPTTEDLSDLFADGSFSDVVAEAIANYLAVNQAAAAARNRAEGAAVVGDAAWVAEQRFAAARYSTEALREQTRLIVAYSLLGDMLTTNVAPDANQILPRLQSEGLPSVLVDSLLRFGWTQDDVDRLENDALAISAEEFEQLDALSYLKLQAVMTAVASREDVEQAVAARLSLDGGPLRRLTVQEQTRLAAMRGEIEDALNTGRVGWSLVDDIVDFLAEVRTLAEETNNLGELESSLDFGLVALLTVQQEAGQLNELRQMLDVARQQGDLTDESASELDALLVRSQSSLRAGSFPAAHRELSDFLDRVRREHGQDIEANTANDLTALASFSTEVLGGVYPWWNPRLSVDVNDDTIVAPVDALIVINELNLTGAGALADPPLGPEALNYLDVNADGFVAPNDVLFVINFLNAPVAAGEGEASRELWLMPTSRQSDAAYSVGERGYAERNSIVRPKPIATSLDLTFVRADVTTPSNPHPTESNSRSSRLELKEDGELLDAILGLGAEPSWLLDAHS